VRDRPQAPSFLFVVEVEHALFIVVAGGAGLGLAWGLRCSLTLWVAPRRLRARRRSARDATGSHGIVARRFGLSLLLACVGHGAPPSIVVHKERGTIRHAWQNVTSRRTRVSARACPQSRGASCERGHIELGADIAEHLEDHGGIMGLLLSILIGAFIGWIASLIMSTDSQQGALANVVIGILGAAIGRWFFGDVLHLGGAQIAGSFTLIGLLWAVLGACLLIALLKLVRVMA
jgi:uncharacterized membrane protein YeaQ/YmgE (transglycosylase-associated protein family)